MSEQVIQRILRHKPGSMVTRKHYIKTPTSDVIEAMQRYEGSLMAAEKLGSPAVPQPVN